VRDRRHEDKSDGGDSDGNDADPSLSHDQAGTMGDQPHPGRYAQVRAT
jgi:hypothetical protein